MTETGFYRLNALPACLLTQQFQVTEQKLQNYTVVAYVKATDVIPERKMYHLQMPDLVQHSHKPCISPTTQ